MSGAGGDGVADGDGLAGCVAGAGGYCIKDIVKVNRHNWHFFHRYALSTPITDKALATTNLGHRTLFIIISRFSIIRQRQRRCNGDCQE